MATAGFVQVAVYSMTGSTQTPIAFVESLMAVSCRELLLDPSFALFIAGSNLGIVINDATFAIGPTMSQ